MAKNKLFDSWTWRRRAPSPFDTVDARRTDVRSHYSPATASASLHTPALCAILAYMQLDHKEELSDPDSAKGALGTQADNFVISEYPSHTGLTHVAIFNDTTGKFTAGKFAEGDDAPKVYMLNEKGDSGAALFFALMPKAIQDDEFQQEYQALWECCKGGYPDMDEAARHATICCDNLYRRIEAPATAGSSGIRAVIPASGNIPPLTKLAYEQGTYNPTSTILGEFAVMQPGRVSARKKTVISAEEFEGQYRISEAALTAAEERLVPRVPAWYSIPPEVVTACKHAKLTTGSAQPMRNFMFRGPAGTGKTEGAKAFAAGIHRPYVHLTCNANFEIYDFLGQMLPDARPKGGVETKLPSLQDIQMDPPSAYYAMTGEYNESITDSEVFDKMVEVLAARVQSQSAEEGRQSYHYVDTPLVKALRYGYVCEIQEPTVIANPGVMVGLNSLLDRCNAITLPTGEVIQRHPDCVLIVTTNIGYEGCRDMNQSVLSRMNLIMDFDQPSAGEMTARVASLTGCTDKSAIRQMVECMDDIIKHCRETITDGSCGMRELISWVQSYMIEGDLMEAAKYTVVSAVSNDPECREEVLNSCLRPRLAH